MNRFLLLLLFYISFSYFSRAQSLGQAANDAYIITRMAEKFHVQPKPLNDDFSNNIFNSFLRELDGERIFFTQEDINKMQPFRLQLDEQIRQKRTDFLQLIIALYQQRIQEADTMINNICKQPFYFSTSEKLTATEDSSYPASTAMKHVKLYKELKLAALEAMLKRNLADTSSQKTLSKKQLDSAEALVRKKVETNFKRSITEMLQSPGGLQQSVENAYCKTIASCYDPHTEYFPLTEKENFESELGNDAYEFGFNIDEDNEEDDDGGGVVISNLKPGSPAFKSGLLNKGDKLVSLQWEGKEPIDVSDADEEEVMKIIDESNHDKITFTIKKSDGSTQHVTLQKEKTQNDDDNKVKSFLLKGSKTIGYISLPAFYSDWKDEEHDINGCANDVSKEILKLQKENINGLIIDLRYNGGGSMEEAVALSGIFIDAGPVEQIKMHDEKIFTLKDANRGAIYTGPLLIMVNGYSASASEMVAGTLQDYNRALIFGSPTYGKATAQVVLPMDTTVNLDNQNSLNKKTKTYLKVTTDKLYRISGATAQSKGVQPDIVVPDIFGAIKDREANEPNALAVPNIEANKYYKPYPPIDVASLKDLAQKEIAEDNYFERLQQYINAYQAMLENKEFSLRFDDALQQRNQFSKVVTELRKAKNVINLNFSVENNEYETQRMKTDESLKEMNEEVKDYLSKDHYLKIAYDVLCAMAK